MGTFLVHVLMRVYMANLVTLCLKNVFCSASDWIRDRVHVSCAQRQDSCPIMSRALDYVME